LVLIFTFSVFAVASANDKRSIKAALDKNQKILNSVADGIYGLDAKGLITFINPAALQILDYQDHELIGKSFHNLIHQGQNKTSKSPDNACRMCQVFDDENIQHGEGETLWRRDGSPVPIAYSSTPIFGDDQQLGLVVAFRNITERKRAEDQLRASEARFRAVTQSAQDTIISVDNNGLIVQWNQGATNLFGYDAQCVIGRSTTFIIPEHYRAAYTQDLNRVLTGGARQVAIIAMEISALRKNGTEFPVELTLSDWSIDGAVFVTSIIRDISERHKANEDLHKLSQTVEQSPNMMFITDTDGAIEYANTEFYRVTGYAPEEVIGKSLNILQSKNTSPSTYKDIWATILAGHVWQAEIQDRCKDGRLFWAHLTIAPIRSQRGNITHFFCGSRRHINAQKCRTGNVPSQRSGHNCQPRKNRPYGKYEP